MLQAVKDFIADHLLISQRDHPLPFCRQGFMPQAPIRRRGVGRAVGIRRIRRRSLALCLVRSKVVIVFLAVIKCFYLWLLELH